MQQKNDTIHKNAILVDIGSVFGVTCARTEKKIINGLSTVHIQRSLASADRNVEHTRQNGIDIAFERSRWENETWVQLLFYERNRQNVRVCEWVLCCVGLCHIRHLSFVTFACDLVNALTRIHAHADTHTHTSLFVPFHLIVLVRGTHTETVAMQCLQQTQATDTSMRPV